MRDLLQRLTAPPAQHLRVLQPTCATVSYTVSTRTLPKTLPVRLAHYIGIILRTVTGLSAAILLLLKWRLTESEKVPNVLMRLLDPIKDWPLLHVVESWQWTYLVPSAFVIMFLALRRDYTGSFLHSSLSLSAWF
jgi:phosphatidylinositol glycan class H protein